MTEKKTPFVLLHELEDKFDKAHLDEIGEMQKHTIEAFANIIDCRGNSSRDADEVQHVLKMMLTESPDTARIVGNMMNYESDFQGELKNLIERAKQILKDAE